MTQLSELREKWARYEQRLSSDDGEGSLLGAAFIIAKTAITDINTLLAENERLRAALRQACDDGWADGEGAMRSYLRDDRGGK